MNGCSLNNKGGSESSADLGTYNPTIDPSLLNREHNAYNGVAGNLPTYHVPAYGMVPDLSTWDPTMTGGQTMEPSSLLREHDESNEVADNIVYIMDNSGDETTR